MTQRPLPRSAAWLLVAASVSSCTTGWARRDPPSPAEVPPAYSSESTVTEVAPHAWWTSLGDPSLDRAVDAVLAENLSLQAAGARVAQADAVARGARASRLPTLDASASVGRSRSGLAPFGPTQNNQFAASVGAAYEIDAWGRLAASREATARDAEAVALDANALRVTLAAAAVEAWLDGVYARHRTALIGRQIETQEILLEILVLRLGAATATALDIEQQRQQIQSLEAQLAPLQAAEATAGHRLSVLQGRAPDAAATAGRDTLPTLPPFPELGVPADLLDRRPDVAAAHARVAAADARTAQAIADRLPTFRLSASLSLQSRTLTDLFSELFWSVAAAVAGPVFDGGRRAAEVDRASAALDERVLLWGEALLNAIAEVENALVLERQQLALIDDLERREATAQRAFALAREQYREGVIDYLRVLSLVSSLEQVQQARLDAQRQLLAHRVQLHRALGGGWEPQREDER